MRIGMAARACMALVAATVLAVPRAHARDLTPEVRAMLFGYPGAVHLDGKTVRIGLKGTDRRGFYKCPYVEVYVNGKGPFTFLFDTGSSYTMVSENVVRAAHLPVMFDRHGERDIVRLARIRIGGLHIDDLWAVHDDDFGVDGVLGFKSFGPLNLLFSLHTREMEVSAEAKRFASGFELPYDMSYNVPTIAIESDAGPIRTLLDTGDDAYAMEFRSADVRGLRFAHPPVPAETVLNGAREAQTLVTTLAEPVRLGPIELRNAAIGLNDALPVSDVGVDLLANFDVSFDLKRARVGFQPLFAGRDLEVAGGLTAGFLPRFGATDLVASVVPGSAADRAGMISGDRIETADGQPVRGYTPMLWDRMLYAGRPIEVHWLKNGQSRSDTFPVQELK